MVVTSNEKITEACSILFGESFTVCKTTIQYLQLSGIKQAFREKAKEYHPDINGDRPECQENFLKLKNAYDFLISVKSENSQSNSEAVPPYRKPNLPRRKLRLGEYLYYSGRISWTDLISAMTWIRHNKNKKIKTRIGFYFIKQGLLSSTEIGFAVFKMNIHNSNY